MGPCPKSASSSPGFLLTPCTKPSLRGEQAKARCCNCFVCDILGLCLAPSPSPHTPETTLALCRAGGDWVGAGWWQRLGQEGRAEGGFAELILAAGADAMCRAEAELGCLGCREPGLSCVWPRGPVTRGRAVCLFCGLRTLSLHSFTFLVINCFPSLTSRCLPVILPCKIEDGVGGGGNSYVRALLLLLLFLKKKKAS